MRGATRRYDRQAVPPQFAWKYWSSAKRTQDDFVAHRAGPYDYRNARCFCGFCLFACSKSDSGFWAKILNRLRRIKHNEDTRAAQYLPFQLPTLRCVCVSRNWEFQAIISTSADINLSDAKSYRYVTKYVYQIGYDASNCTYCAYLLCKFHLTRGEEVCAYGILTWDFNLYFLWLKFEYIAYKTLLLARILLAALTHRVPYGFYLSLLVSQRGREKCVDTFAKAHHSVTIILILD